MKKRVILLTGAILAMVGLSLDNAGKVSAPAEAAAETYYIPHSENEMFMYGQERVQEDLNRRLGIN